MSGDSKFFTLPSAQDIMSAKHMMRISVSKEGWSEIHRVEKNGRFRVYKALKEDCRGFQPYEMFLRKEFHIGYQMDHVNICQTYSYLDTEDLGHVIEMEYIDGCSLEELLEKGSLSPKKSRRIALQIIDALSYIHSKQVIHRDIKPSNILITHSGGNVKLIDFGVADNDTFRVFKEAAGTESYAAPETLKEGKTSIESDIYSLGKVLEKLLPQEQSIIKNCCNEDPAKRYHNVEDIRTDLQRQRPVLMYLAIAALSIIIIGTLLALSLLKEKTTTEVELTENQQQEEKATDAAILSTEDIDEVFRQATELIMMNED